MIFPSQALDPEPFAAGQVLHANRWLAISSLPGVDLARVAELQVTAAGRRTRRSTRRASSPRSDQVVALDTDLG